MKYVLIMFLLCIGCKKEGESYIVKDRFGKEHKYDINHSVNKDKATIYCQLHYKWETIQHYRTTEGIEYWMRKFKYYK